MVPFDFFYSVMRDVFLDKLDANLYHQLPDVSSGAKFCRTNLNLDRSKPFVLFYDQEPIDCSVITEKFIPDWMRQHYSGRFLINSEQSIDKNYILKALDIQDVHYFYHALLCSEWYRTYWYGDPQVNLDFTHTYITYNNLSLDKRLYRANLIAELENRGIIDQGLISFKAVQESELLASLDAYQLLPTTHKINIILNTDKLLTTRTIDTGNIHGALSADINIPSMQRAFVNLVTETVFYENRVHLTEKIFKPIVAKMPFLLMAGVGNLAYLRSYGFKTFGDYWDEGYDSIQNNADRFAAVINQLEQLCKRPHHELVSMKRDMQGVLEYNYLHFFKAMRPIVVSELTNNFETALKTTGVEYNCADLQNLNRILTC